MSGLLRAELMRVRARSAVWGTAVVLVVAALGFVVAAWDDTRPPSAAQVAEAHEQLALATQVWEHLHELREQECADGSADGAADGTAVESSCEPLGPPPLLDEFIPYRPGLVETLEVRYEPMAVVVVLGLLVMGVTLVTADFGSGAMGTWLTFAPRRGRVLVSRVVASLAAAVPVALGALGTGLVGVVVVVAVNGATGDASGAVPLVALATARALAAGLWATAVGVGLAFALRVGAGVAGLVVWWVAACETALPLIVPVTRPMTLGTNLRAWLDGGTTYVVDECVDLPTETVCAPVEHVVGWTQGGGVLLVVALVVVGLGALSFRVRDVA
ncbi:ABC transporter permease subunit [Cellulomonas palmilytica]|uniref:ABC transporter permease subunit n=1 Tax=Cellulomonas palmilytica TaxID=2608402 RepID=UPI001F1BE108|nr:ABC transporter permease subunit [Cellulomonas palmilytica]UJP41381.1 hypothetical protein F1D97_08180 [Cellulomonas palmilytica]